MKTYLKTLAQAFTKHKTRFLSIIFMVLLSVGLVSGLGSTVNKIDDSLTLFYEERRVNDFVIKKRSGDFSNEEIDLLVARYGAENLERGAAFDVNMKIGEETQLVRLYFTNGEQKLNRTASAEKKTYSESEQPLYPVQAEEKDDYIKGIPLGLNITLDFGDIVGQLLAQSKRPQAEKDAALSYLNSLSEENKTVQVTATETVRSPLTFSVNSEPSYTNPENTATPDTNGAANALIGIDNLLYLSGETVPVAVRSMVPMSDMRITYSDRALFSAFSKEYKSMTERESKFLEEKITDCKVLTLYENFSFCALHGYASKVMDICIMLMVAFLLITALVVLSNMTRLIEEERAEIATLRTLGYSGYKIVFKYLLFAALANGVGGTGGYFVGYGLMRLIYYVFNHSFVMPPMASGFSIFFFLVTFIAITVATLAATAISGIRLMNETPATLLRPKAPKAGKKVFLERIPFIWKRLPFRHKSTARNVLRYMGRFLMTIISIACSMALMSAACGLFDRCVFNLKDPAIMGVAVIVAVFAGLITMVVVYTLTSINISERNRELATLKVLGYQDNEVAVYIYREVYLDSFFGILLGYPLGVLFVHFVFQIVGLGTLTEISWYTWFVSPVLVMLFTALTTLVLMRKIVRIDMNESLKANE